MLVLLQAVMHNRGLLEALGRSAGRRECGDIERPHPGARLTLWRILLGRFSIYGFSQGAGRGLAFETTRLTRYAIPARALRVSGA